MSTHINLRMLSYLVALADTRHFGKAADACFVSQPTLSAQVKKLEEQLQVVLVERQPRNILLTPAGEAIVALARKMLAEADEIERIARAQQDPLGATLKLGFIPTLGPYLLPHIVAPLRKTLPRLKCLFVEYQTDPLLGHLRDGGIDLALLALPVDTEGLRARVLFREPFRLALPAGHALAKKTRISIADLEGESFMLLEDGHCLRDQALEICALSGIREDTDFRATSLETLRQMVAAGAGMTLMPALAIDNPVSRTRDVTAVHFRNPAPSRPIAAVWRTSSARGLAIEAICDTIVACLPHIESLESAP